MALGDGAHRWGRQTTLGEGCRPHTLRPHRRRPPWLGQPTLV